MWQTALTLWSVVLTIYSVFISSSLAAELNGCEVTRQSLLDCDGGKTWNCTYTITYCNESPIMLCYKTSREPIITHPGPAPAVNQGSATFCITDGMEFSCCVTSVNKTKSILENNCDEYRSAGWPTTVKPTTCTMNGDGAGDLSESELAVIVNMIKTFQAKIPVRSIKFIAVFLAFIIILLITMVSILLWTSFKQLKDLESQLAIIKEQLKVPLDESKDTLKELNDNNKEQLEDLKVLIDESNETLKELMNNNKKQLEELKVQINESKETLKNLHEITKTLAPEVPEKGKEENKL